MTPTARPLTAPKPLALRRLARIAIVAALALSTLAYGALDKKVTVEVEGRPVSIRTFAMRVGDALDRAGVTLGPQDRVVPSPTSSLSDGSVIRVFRAKEVTLLLDGHRRRVVVTGLTIGQVLEEIRLRGSVADVVRPSRAARVVSGMTITYRRAVDVTVIHDGHSERVITNSATVRAVVRELGVRLGSRDRLQPAGNVRPARGMTIRIVRVGIQKVVKQVEVPFRTVLVRDRHMLYGTRRVRSPGHSGARVEHLLVKYVDGRPVWRKIVVARVIRKPQTRVIAIGSSFPGCVCDKGTSTGKATWYGQADGMTAAHRWLPMGTVVHVKNLSNGKTVNVVIRDRGPYGQDRIIDLSDESFRRLAPLGTGIIHVRIWW
jgi:uncharacterized protein YabE (DUF348 family)